MVAEMLETFWWWIQERHRVYLRRTRGEPPPWTDDQILAKNFFTCPYRELDRVTREFRTTIRDPLAEDESVFFATVVFRWFNLPSTAELLMGESGLGGRSDLLTRWDGAEAGQRLSAARASGTKLFTGAYISCLGTDMAIHGLNEVWGRRRELRRRITDGGTLENAVNVLIEVPGIGRFVAYEIACDLRYTSVLRHATDRLTWANPGPGSVRGLYRLLGMGLSKYSNTQKPPTVKTWSRDIQSLLRRSKVRLAHMPAFEARDIEHSLCEFDKYMRIKDGSGVNKRRFSAPDKPSGSCPKRVLLVGERVNAPAVEVRSDAWSEIAFSMGAFIDAVNRSKLKRVGVDVDDSRLDSVNLMPPGRLSWDRAFAEEVADAVSLDRYHTAMLCGRRVAEAFGVRYSPGSVTVRGQTSLVSLPHPSDLCRFWNDGDDVSKIRGIVLALMENRRA